jgi:hypothetical protein
MSTLILPDKKTLLAALSDSGRRAAQWFDAFPTESFFNRTPAAWSASDNLDHLIKAVKPICLAMKMPRRSLQIMFGKSGRPSRTYEEIREVYRGELAKGARASGRFLPDQEYSDAQAGERKRRLVERWEKAVSELAAVVDRWSEADMNRYQLPHPILGRLTVREMLFFAIYHNLRHASQEGD